MPLPTLPNGTISRITFKVRTVRLSVSRSPHFFFPDFVMSERPIRANPRARDSESGSGCRYLFLETLICPPCSNPPDALRAGGLARRSRRRSETTVGDVLKTSVTQDNGVYRTRGRTVALSPPASLSPRAQMERALCSAEIFESLPFPLPQQSHLDIAFGTAYAGNYSLGSFWSPRSCPRVHSPASCNPVSLNVADESSSACRSFSFPRFFFFFLSLSFSFLAPFVNGLQE